MTAAASLSESVLQVQPGEEASCDITVRNTGTVVDQFALEVAGDAAAWTTVEPASVSLFPGGEETVRVRFHPPRTSKVLAGPVPFGIKVVPHEEPDASMVEEGTVEVGAFVDTTAELLPHTSRGRRRGVHELAVDNRGNTKLKATFSAADTDRLLEFNLEPPSMVVKPGEAMFSKVVVLPVKRFWRGSPQTLPFQVVVVPEQGVPLAVDGTFLLEPRLPRWLPRLLALLALAALLLFVLWLTVLRPVIGAAARQAIEEELAEAQEQLAAATEQAAAAGEQAAAAQQQGEEAAEQAALAAEEATEAQERVGDLGVTVGSQDLGDPFDFRLTRSVDAGQEDSESFTVPDEEQVVLTDIVLQNPEGNSGIVQIRRVADDSTQVLLEVRLDNFRDLDYHFVSPVQVQAGQQVVLFVRCENDDGQACNPAAYFSGFKKEVPAEDDAEDNG